MIRSRAANILVVAFGSLLLTLVCAASWDAIRQNGPAGLADPYFLLFIALPFGGTGLWCVIGGRSNLHRLRESGVAALPEPSRPFHVCLFALASIGVLVMIAGVILASRSGSRIPEIVCGVGFWFVITSVVLLPFALVRSKRKDSLTRARGGAV